MKKNYDLLTVLLVAMVFVMTVVETIKVLPLIAIWALMIVYFQKQGWLKDIKEYIMKQEWLKDIKEYIMKREGDSGNGNNEE